MVKPINPNEVISRAKQTMANNQRTSQEAYDRKVNAAANSIQGDFQFTMDIRAQNPTPDSNRTVDRYGGETHGLSADQVQDVARELQERGYSAFVEDGRVKMHTRRIDSYVNEANQVLKDTSDFSESGGIRNGVLSVEVLGTMNAPGEVQDAVAKKFEDAGYDVGYRPGRKGIVISKRVE